MGLLSDVVDRALDRVVGPPAPPVRPEAAAFHAGLPVVDLLVGTVLFRPTFLRRLRHGHVDLPRARQGGLGLAGFSIATRFPDLRGTLSDVHFRSLGLSGPQRASDLALVEAFVARIEGWAGASGGRLRLLGPDGDAARELDAVGRDDALRAFIGVQGGQVLAPDLGRAAHLRRLGVRMLAPAHVMDTPLAGSGTGRHAGGLTGLGREAIVELERTGIMVDLAHASAATIREAVPLLRRPFVVSHTGLLALAGGRSHWRRYSPATRNLGEAELRLVGEAGGLVGLTLSTSLLGGRDLAAVVRALAHLVELIGAHRVALGSDFDGALAMPFDVTGLPALTQALLEAGFGREVVAGIMGGNAIRHLQAAWAPAPAAIRDQAE